ncbi:MAG: transposase [Oscillospiraceae bacterium]|nr:transposase [Oscillospiraceae bacterium]
MAYEVKYRERVIAFMDAGHTRKETKELFNVGYSTLTEWRKLKAETGSLQKRPLKRTFKKVDPVKLEVYVGEHQDAYLQEIADEFGCAEHSIRVALKKLKITRKKRRRSTSSEMKKSVLNSTKE